MPETIHEFTVTLTLDARPDSDHEAEELLLGVLEIQQGGEWMLMGDALAEWLVQVLPGHVYGATATIKATERWQGVVTTTMLNVRSQPGTEPDNPVVAKLPQGTEVMVFEQRAVAGETWYRIGPDRWVHSQYVMDRPMGGDGGVSTPGKTRPATGKTTPRKMTKIGAVKPVSAAK